MFIKPLLSPVLNRDDLLKQARVIFWGSSGADLELLIASRVNLDANNKERLTNFE